MRAVEILFYATQIACVIALVFNALVAINSFHHEIWWALIINVACVVLLLTVMIKNELRMREIRRRRHWQEIDISAWYQKELLDGCIIRGICPDCGGAKFDGGTLTCCDPRCGSRFHRDANGTWTRR